MGRGAIGVTSTALSVLMSFRVGGTLTTGLILKGKFKASGGFLAALF